MPEVFRETVEVGLARGLPNAEPIRQLFERGKIGLRDPRRKEKLPGISQADSLVLHLARELPAEESLVNDQALLAKMKGRGLVVHYTAEFAQALYAEDRISLQRRDDLFREFLLRGRYTEMLLQHIALGGSPWSR